jgi:glutathione synthase/RimK-type ligase-like ATP-grasp enzyme
MIFLCGIPSETPLRLIANRLEAEGAKFVMFNQREFADCDIALDIVAGRADGQLRIRDTIYPLDEFTAIYSRLMDDRCLPELDDEPTESPLRRQCRGFHETLTRWMEIAPALLINRAAAIATNMSKPYQAQLIREQGFLVPETLITTDPGLVTDFRARHKKIIYKSISAMRSIVHTFEDNDLSRLDHIRWCPTQFQAFIEGTNLRVHVVEDEVYASAVDSEATDYRYAARQCGKPAALREVDLSEELAAKCVNLSRALGLTFSGIDLKVTPADEVFCFEVNPSPAYTYYECNTGQPISKAVAQRLIKG